MDPGELAIQWKCTCGVLILVLMAVWSTGHDLARHEQYAATAAVWFFWVAVTALVVGS